MQQEPKREEKEKEKEEEGRRSTRKKQATSVYGRDGVESDKVNARVPNGFVERGVCVCVCAHSRVRVA